MILDEKMFPGGWNSQIETNNTEHYLDPVLSALEKKEMIPGAWVRQMKAANIQIHPGFVHPGFVMSKSFQI